MSEMYLENIETKTSNELNVIFLQNTGHVQKVTRLKLHLSRRKTNSERNVNFIQDIRCV